MLLLYVLCVFALCTAQAADRMKLELANGAKAQKHQESDALMRQVGEMGMLIENYRRVILNGIMEATDLCGFIDRLSDIEGVSDKSPDGNLIFWLIVFLVYRKCS